MTATSTGTKLGIRKITARIGAEVTGVSPSLEFDPDTVTAIRAALEEHKALVFRGIDVDDEGQQRFAAYFGPLTSAHPTVPAIDGEPNVLPVDSENSRSNHWHTDVTFVLNPPQVSTLRSIVIPPYGGETLIANAGAAYRDLPGPVPPESLDKAKQARREVFVSTRYETVHPVVRVHPLTGERGLFIGGFAHRIAGLSTGESKDILRLLQHYVTRPENILRVSWEPGQLVLFDNRITQHYAVDNYDDLPRRLNRVTVAGDIPVGVDGQPSSSVTGDASHYTPVAQVRAAA
jgi:alpha-ketoglutarate-dependent sulfate ester dioxygenase